ncbi:G-type lectin S-receptor-like serine/threonine-protein kinase LECRK3 [Populus alba]|uniref:G-type lectin S-receptor-like serine/threonine-protein kinase LECRK3 n=1 Tax=Populus alba TaxID=43335 RepID=UPI00158C6D69|nr:G-type lectin S-receptor-like serine/threonine-protein kinase LECRK3 [Populus alba]
MALVSGLLLLMLSILFVEARTQTNQIGEIHLGSQLSPISNMHSWLSPSGHFAFGFYSQGNGFAVGIWMMGQPNNTVVWTANRDDEPVSINATIHLSEEGKLLLRTEQGNENLIADVSEVAASASMLDSGNFVLYNGSSVIWQSFDEYPTDTILVGQNLTYSDKLVSSVSSSNHSSGRFLLKMQGDGNLVAYPTNSARQDVDTYWASHTTGDNQGWSYLSTLYLNHQGFLSMVTVSKKPVLLARSSYPCNNKTTIFRATLDADGIFRLYSHCLENKTSWSVHIEWSALNNQCNVHGFCDLNSYCSGMGTNADCSCYPGFAFNDPSEKFSGCYKNVTESFCRGTKEGKIYDVKAVENILFERYPYSVLHVKKETCRLSCLKDCLCDVALYMNERCEKYTAPIRYGLKDINISSIAFFKVKAASHAAPPMSPTIIIESKKSLLVFLAIAFGSVTFLCFVIAISTFCVYRDRAYLYEKLSGIISLAGEFTLRSFSYSELEKATGGFMEELGRGSIGAVYRGTIPEGDRTVAVKRLEKVLDEGEKKFRAEITVIGQTYHRNLVRLLGFCVEGSRRVLVYEYLRNGTLADLLFQSERRPIWKERVRIALDIARGILYLHEECQACIIHCNITPQNILMDDSWMAKISDFGLSKLLYPDEIRSSMALSQSRGHMAPEWQNNALMSVKADIYSFGVVLLEIICCRSSIKVDVSTPDEMNLPGWAYQCFAAGQVDKLVKDEVIEFESLERMVKIGLLCVQHDPASRPCIKNVILMLEGSEDIPTPPAIAPFRSTA